MNIRNSNIKIKFEPNFDFIMGLIIGMLLATNLISLFK